MNSVIKTVVILLVGMFLIKISIADQMRGGKSAPPVKANQNKTFVPKVSFFH